MIGQAQGISLQSDVMHHWNSSTQFKLTISSYYWSNYWPHDPDYFSFDQFRLQSSHLLRFLLQFDNRWMLGNSNSYWHISWPLREPSSQPLFLQSFLQVKMVWIGLSFYPALHLLPLEPHPTWPLRSMDIVYSFKSMMPILNWLKTFLTHARVSFALWLLVYSSGCHLLVLCRYTYDICFSFWPWFPSRPFLTLPSISFLSPVETP